MMLERALVTPESRNTKYLVQSEGSAAQRVPKTMAPMLTVKKEARELRMSVKTTFSAPFVAMNVRELYKTCRF